MQANFYNHLNILCPGKEAAMGIMVGLLADFRHPNVALELGLVRHTTTVGNCGQNYTYLQEEINSYEVDQSW